MPTHYTSDKRLYATADRRRVVAEGDPEAAVLVLGAGRVVTEAEAKALGVLDHLRPYESEDRIAQERAALDAAKARGSFDEAAVREQNLVRMKMEAEAVQAGGVRVVRSGGDQPPSVEGAVPMVQADRAPAAGERRAVSGKDGK